VSVLERGPNPVPPTQKCVGVAAQLNDTGVVTNPEAIASRNPLVPPPDDGIDRIALVGRAYQELGFAGTIKNLIEVSANVSTNSVYRVVLESGHELIAKASSYGSYVHFRQDHKLIVQWNRLMGGTRFSRFLAPVILKDHEAFTYREGVWFVVFYEKAPFYDFLPKRITPDQVRALGRELAHFHVTSAIAAKRMNRSWKSVGSDIASLFDALGNRSWRLERGFDDSTEVTLRAQCETFLNNAEKLGYHSFDKVPILIDWNIGNFSVGLEQQGFRLYTRWDYDWFRIEPRTFDFYFCARVVRSEGDKTLFSYTADPLFEPPFGSFLQQYHRVNPLSENEVLFLKEAYRFFILNYVIRSGEHFFRRGYCSRLQTEALENYLPRLETFDFQRLLNFIT
jgi:hypothetical protein